MSEVNLLKALGNIDDFYIKEAEPMKKTNRKFWAAIAACFALAAVIGVFASGLFGQEPDTFTLESGETITFAESSTLASEFDLDVTVRKMTDAELRQLFAGLPVTANAYFHPDSGEPLGLEGRIGDVKLIVSAAGTNLLDTVVAGSEYASAVAGVPVNAGYFITAARNTIIYYASFTLGENTVYVEFSGALESRDAVKAELAGTVLTLIENGAFDLRTIRK